MRHYARVVTAAATVVQSSQPVLSLINILTPPGRLAVCSSFTTMMMASFALLITVMFPHKEFGFESMAPNCTYRETQLSALVRNDGRMCLTHLLMLPKVVVPLPWSLLLTKAFTVRSWRQRRRTVVWRLRC